jgi:hypothetical protein
MQILTLGMSLSTLLVVSLLAPPCQATEYHIDTQYWPNIQNIGILQSNSKKGNLCRI